MTLTRQRWLARLSVALIAAAIAILIAIAGPSSISVILAGVLAWCVMLAAGYWFLAHRGLARWAAFCLAVAAPAGLIALYAVNSLLWVAVTSVVMLAAGLAAGSLAMGEERASPREHQAQRPRHAFLIMNPRSGGGKVG